MPNQAGLIELVERLPRSRVVLVGDLMLDRYVYGNAERLSPEAPVPVLHFQNEELRLGGAGGVAAMLAALGADVRVVGVLGADGAGAEVRRQLAACGAAVASLVQTTDRMTVSKVRLVGLAQHRHPQQMIRLDYEDHSPLPPALAAQVREHVLAELASADLLLLEDYNKGVLAPVVCREVIRAAGSRGIPVLIDPANLPDYSRYAGATALKLNRIEAARASGLPVDGPDDYDAAGTLLLDRLALEAAVITLDKSGAYLATRDGERRWVKTRPRQVYDVTGAGDMVLAMLAMARAAGATWVEAVSLANVAGGLEVEKIGVATVSREEILNDLLHSPAPADPQAASNKLRTIPRLLPELDARRRLGQKIAFTNGCFDILHLGHVQYLTEARAQADCLVVGLNTDASVRTLKGPGRPVNPEEARAAVLAGLAVVDYLILFGEQTPIELIKAVKPDVLVKGADYRKDQVVGADLVESYGGRVHLAGLRDGYSTTKLIQQMRVA